MIIFIIIWSLVPSLLPFWMQLILPSFVRWLGILVDVIVILTMVWVGIHLGKQVSGTLEIKKGHELVTSGPYKYIRHPMYLVYLVFNLGLLIVCLNLIAIVIIIIGILVLIPRMRSEEQMMIEQFGEPYREYMKRTGRLFPKIKREEKK